MAKRQEAGSDHLVHLEDGPVLRWAGHHLDILGRGHFLRDGPWVVSAWSPEKRGVPETLVLSMGLHVSVWDLGSGWTVGGNVGPKQKGQCLGLTVALLWFVAPAEAARAPRAGSPGPSRSAGAGRPGSPQGALCATAAAGATAGSASVT